MKKINLPLVSVVTPSFNQAEFIEETILSVKNQDYPNIEHIVIDGGSTDGTIDILKKYPHLIWISEPDKGQSDAINKGFRMAKGEIIGWLNSDDWYEPNVFEAIAKWFIENPDKTMVMGDCKLINDQGRIFSKVVNYERGFEELSRFWIGGSIPTQPAIFFRRFLLDEFGCLDITLHYAMDYDLWMRFASKNRFHHIDKTVANYRFHQAAKGGDLDWNKFIPDCKIVYNRYMKQQKHALVSVIIPCYNQALFLSEAVESIVKQTYKDWEIIIVNDGSPDNTSKVARELIEKCPDKKIILLEKENGGVADARNVGIRNSKGKYILPFDADDVILPDMLQKTVALLEANPNIAIAYTDVMYFGIKDEVGYAGEYDFECLRYQNHLSYCSLYRREAWEFTCGYNTNMALGYEDWDFWITCGEKGFYGKRIPEPLFKYRVKENSRDTKAVKHNDKLRAQIIFNHPGIYAKEDIAWAEKILGKKLIKEMSQRNTIEEKKRFADMVYFHHFHLGCIYTMEGKFDEALNEYQKALSLEPPDKNTRANILIALGNVYSQQGKFKKAEDKLKNTLSLGSKDKNIICSLHYALGSNYKREDLFDKAKEEFEEVLKIAKEIPSTLDKNRFASGAHFHLGQTYQEMRKEDKAKLEYEECLKLNPEHKKAREHLLYLVDTDPQK
ncbi:glycosyltransferase [bacterium]|nr:glycosyltransferase [bacterium]